MGIVIKVIMSNLRPKIILDSSVLKQNVLLNTGDGHWLKKLAEHGLLELHLPTIVKNEILTQFKESYKKSTTNAYETFFKQLNKNKLTNDFETSLGSIEREVSSLYNYKVEELVNFYNSDLFIESDIEQGDASKVFENYFTGSGCFKSVKSRKDIPDAFIYEAINRLSKNEVVYFIAEDQTFREAVELNFGSKVFESIEKLFSEDELVKEIKSKLEEEEVYKAELKIVKDAINIDFYLSAIESGHISDEIQDLIYNEQAFSPGSDRYDSGESFSIEDVDFIQPPTKASNFEYFGDGEGSLEFETTGRVYLEHFVHIGDLHHYNEVMSQISMENVNDYTYRIIEPAIVNIRLESRFEIEQDILNKAVSESWTGKKLGRELGSAINHEISILEVEFQHFDIKMPFVSHGKIDEFNQKKCTVCGEDLGSCEH